MSLFLFWIPLTFFLAIFQALVSLQIFSFSFPFFLLLLLSFSFLLLHLPFLLHTPYPSRSPRPSRLHLSFLSCFSLFLLSITHLPCRQTLVTDFQVSLKFDFVSVNEKKVRAIGECENCVDNDRERGKRKRLMEESVKRDISKAFQEYAISRRRNKRK